MASKKVFTNLSFEGNSELINPKLHPGSAPASKGPGQAYFDTGTGGTLNLQFAAAGATNDWKAVHTSGVPFSTDVLFTSTMADGNPPLAVTSKTVIPNLTVEALGTPGGTPSSGFHVRSTTATEHGIPVYASGGQLKVALVPSADSDSASKQYVDTTAQGLTIIDPCYHATAAALPACTYANGTAGVGATLTANANAALTIDGTAASAGKRVLVKDQAAELQNGIYTVTTAGDESTAFVLTRATDYDQQGEIIDGDFVFVQEGTVNANRGFVQTANFWTASTGTMGTHAIQWTQFSGAGQITAGDGLAKSGDTLSVDLAASTPLEFASNKLSMAAIDTVHLANDAVEPAQLLDTGAFTMGGLTVNGAIAGTTLTLDGDTGEPTFGLKRDHSSNNNILEAKLAIVQAGTTDFGDLVFRTKTTASSAGDSSNFTDQITIAGETGHVGIGTGTTTPAGQLHIADSATGDNDAVYIQNTNNNNNDTAALRFGFSGSVNANKGGIFFKRTANYGRGSLIFATENTANDDNVANSDAKLTIDAAGLATFSDDVKVTGGLGVGTVETTEGALTTTGAITVGSTATTNKLIGITRISKLDNSPDGTAAGNVFDDLVVGSTATTNTGITIFGTSQTGIAFGDVGSNLQGQIRFNHGSNQFEWMVDGSFYAMLLSSSGLNVTDSLTAGGALTTGGIVNHGGFPTVNSSTVQGLQDGACYDFDGTDGYIAVGTSLWSANGDRTFSIWLKADDFATQHNIFHTEGGSGDFMIHTDGTIRIHPYTGNWQNTTSAISTGVWYHIVLTQTSSTRKIYVDGVEQTLGSPGEGSPQTEAWNVPDGELRIGEEGNSRDFFDGQIRDVKIFPSALDAGDVRKLYSGENPSEKDLRGVDLVTNGTAWTGATGSTKPNSWTLGIAGTYTIDSSSGSGSEPALKIARNGSTDHPYIYQTFAVVTGRKYRVTYRVKNVDATKISVGIGSTAANDQYNLTHQTSTSWADFDQTFLATTNLFSVYAQVSTSTGTQSAYIDSFSVQEVGTLVDFNPRSASTSGWYNEAIPALYNGTLQGGVTLSQGNSYWNNIKQVGSDVKATADLEVFKEAGVVGNNYVEGTVKVGGASEALGGTLSYASAGSGQFNISSLNSSGGANNKIQLGFGAVTSGSPATVALTLDQSQNAKVHGNLGVGMDPASTVGLAVNETGDYILGLYRSGTPEWFLNVDTNGTFALHENGVGDKLTIAAGGNATFANQLAVTNELTANGGVYVTAGTLKLDDIAESIDFMQSGAINFDSNDNQTGRVLTIGSGRAAGATGGTSHLSIDQSGVQNHFANRIVNSQTVTDLHRTAEPSLRFDKDGDKVEIPFSSALNFGTGDFTLEAWVKGPSTATDDYRAIYVRSGTAGISWITNTGTGVPRFWLGNSQSNGTTNLLDDKWHHVVLVRDGDTVAHYVDGVVEPLTLVTGATVGDLADTGYAALDHTHVSAGGTVGISGSNYDWDGEIRGFSLHNRALDADEVAASYNGESTPFKYADASPTDKVEANSAGSGTAWTGATGSTPPTGWEAMGINRVYTIVSSTLRIASGAAGSAGIKWGGATTKGKAYIVTFRYYHESGAEMKIGFNDGATTVDLANATSWTNQSHEWISTTEADAESFFIQVVTADKDGWVDDVKIYEAGEVAAYTPQSIAGGGSTSGGQWFDTTSNANHGTIHEATVVNPIKLGPLEIGTENQAIFRHDAAVSNPLRLINRNGANNDYTVLDFKNKDGDSVGGYLPAGLGVKTTDANNRTGRMEFWVAGGGGSDNYSKSAHKRLELANTGSVTATQKDSGGDLAQVTRSHNCEVTFASASNATQVVVNHGLKTKFVHVTVREDATFAEVEIANRSGDWSTGSLDSGTESTHVTIDWASADEWASAEKKYYVAISGGHNGNDSTESE